MSQFLRPNIRAMAGYAPGEQPRDGTFIKLNSNENPYPPSPRVFEAIQAALTGDRLRKYPDPVATPFRQAPGRILGVDPDRFLMGNGWDDILRRGPRPFAPEGGLFAAPRPVYFLYPTLPDTQGARFRAAPYTANWQL